MEPEDRQNPEPGPRGFRIVFSDEYLAVIDKGWDLVVHPAPSYEGETLVDLLGEQLAGGDDAERPGIVHRLDRGTSGLMVVAREEETHADLQRMIRDRKVSRIYTALADGRFRSRTGTIDAPVGRASRKRHRMAVNGAASREAVTHFEVVEALRRESLLEVKLETGRTHQIRVHMEAIGHPLVGDHVYNGPVRYGLTRQFLHSARLGFPHPRTGEQMSFTAPLPEDLATALESARKADSL
ncbi:MAG: RluA family pseudouridine synthase [Solirubrobacterales bacterium]|nr:RluA family pseudouridine synthase [Solirubrobacterales bacterium]MCB0859833.1 RluA family pseudouridine synthase [Solirubrobacterales bacterium]